MTQQPVLGECAFNQSEEKRQTPDKNKKNQHLKAIRFNAATTRYKKCSQSSRRKKNACRYIVKKTVTVYLGQAFRLSQYI